MVVKIFIALPNDLVVLNVDHENAGNMTRYWHCFAFNYGRFFCREAFPLNHEFLSLAFFEPVDRIEASKYLVEYEIAGLSFLLLQVESIDFCLLHSFQV